MGLNPVGLGGIPVDGLAVGFLGEDRVLSPSDDLTFGRSADLVIDENPFMHRIVGRFVHREGVWWLQNHGSKIRLQLHDLDQRSRLEAAPSQQVPIVSNSFSVTFTAGPTSYELTGQRPGGQLHIDEAGEVVGTATIDFAAIPLSPEQHLLLVAMYESKLRMGALEGNAQIARRLGWSPKKFNRKLDTICDKLARAGVAGLKGRPGELAESRREILLAHAERVGLVGRSDLNLLRGVS